MGIVPNLDKGCVNLVLLLLLVLKLISGCMRCLMFYLEDTVATSCQYDEDKQVENLANGG